MLPELSIGYSPCPNDTFIFHALVHHCISLKHATLAEPVLEDVETLNRRALEGALDITKLSFHALGHVSDRYVVLGAGAALGRGCGPLLVAKLGKMIDLAHARIAVPGKYTTAAMLLRLYAPQAKNFQVIRFDKIMNAVAEGQVDCGVIIHESRFTYQDHGLEAVQDLGLWWEELTGLPIPLGCIAVRRTLSMEIVQELDHAVRESLVWARTYPDQCMDYVRQYAQEMDETVLHNHISLYVNDFSLDMGDEGKAAVEELLRRGRAAGIFPAATTDKWYIA